MIFNLGLEISCHILDYSSYNMKIYFQIQYTQTVKKKKSLSHDRLLTKSKSHGTGNRSCTWIQNWLADRQRRVGLNVKASDWLRVTSGVPQVSILGTIICINYINELETGNSTNISKFAGNTKLGNEAQQRKIVS